MRVPLAVCRHKGHALAGPNILWHTRYRNGEKYMVRECRICANERYRAKRRARKLVQEARAIATFEL